MIVRNFEELKPSGRYAEKSGVWSSARYLLKEDGVGFTLTQTTLAAGQSLELEYKNHIEANLVIEGEAVLTELSSGTKYRLLPGSMYALDEHDRHHMQAITDMRIVCVFTPALTGNETHDEDGSYPLL
ncbi:ectoine synthase [bacterium]|nr:ectoine synthase [bacterium]